MILKEFAVDPKLFRSIVNCQLILPLFGASEGKLISRFPKKWKRLAFEEAKRHASDIELAAITERLNRIDDRVLFRSGRRGGEDNLPWLENALKESLYNPFAGVLTDEMDCKGAICLNELDVNVGPFARGRQMQVRRTAEEMAEAVGLIFQSGRVYKFIDPHIAPVQRYVRPLVAFMEAIKSRKTSSDDVFVECHLATSGSHNEEKTFKSNFYRILSDKVPNGIEVSFYFHPKKKMHDRWILTTWAGVQFGHGLDEGEEPPLVNITLLDEGMRKCHWDDYPAN